MSSSPPSSLHECPSAKISSETNANSDHPDIARRLVPPARTLVSKVDDMGGNVPHLRDLPPEKHLPNPVSIPGKRHPIADGGGMVVAASMRRRLEYELMHDQCDPHIVFNFCGGLVKGTREFEEAYYKARIQSFNKYQRVGIVPVLGAQPNAEASVMDQKSLLAPHPMAVKHLRHLIHHFGIWVIGLLALQIFAAWRISELASNQLDDVRYFYFAVSVFLVLAFDSIVWFRLQGKHCHAFYAPGIALLLLAILPIFILHVRASVLTM